MTALIDGGVLADECLAEDGRVIGCPGILEPHVCEVQGQQQRFLRCRGVPTKERHRVHFLHGSVFQGHTRLSALDVVGLCHCFGSSKSPEVASMDIGLHRTACKTLQEEGWAIVHDSVVHTRGQYIAFGRHDVTGEPGWEACAFAFLNEHGERRIRVEKGVQQVEGFWRHLKHDDSGIPEEVRAHDERLNLYIQVHVWRRQICGDPLP